MKEVLVTGGSGLVGSRFIELYKGKYKFITPDLPGFDMTDKSQVASLFDKLNPEIIINFAAHTNLSEAENQRDDKSGLCWRINVEGVKNLIDKVPVDCLFVQISTDNVFPGSDEYPGPYPENAETERDSAKLTWYGFTKEQAERIVMARKGSKATILRLIYPFSAKYELKMDFLRKPLSLFDEGKLYPMFNDQQVSVVLVDKVAEALAKIIDGEKRGIFHASSENTGTPFEIATYVIEKSRGVKDAVKPSSLDEFLKTADNPVRYPKYGGLKVEKTQKELGIKFGTWQEMVDEFVRQQGKGI
jgi:dTDP-4-dehydrorhamnose reductase